MTNFISNLISRHTEPARHVKPRVRGVFESVGSPPEPVTSVPQNDQNESSQQGLPSQKLQTASDKSGPVNQTRNVSALMESNSVPLLDTPERLNHPQIVNDAGKGKQFDNHESDINRDMVFPAQPRQDSSVSPGFKNSILSTEPYRGDTSPHGVVREFSNVQDITSSLLTQKKQAATGSGMFQNQIEDVQSSAAGLNRVTIPSIYSSVSDKTPYDSEPSGELNGGYSSFKTGFGQSQLEGQQFRHEGSESHDRIHSQAKPVIKVSIGRIDVRAISQPAASAPKSKASVKPKMTLQDYLTRRDNGTK